MHITIYYGYQTADEKRFVLIPDLPDCFAEGTSIDEVSDSIVQMVYENLAIDPELLERLVQAGPSTVSQLSEMPEYHSFCWFPVVIDTEKVRQSRMVRVNLRNDQWAALDAEMTVRDIDLKQLVEEALIGFIRINLPQASSPAAELAPPSEIQVQQNESELLNE